MNIPHPVLIGIFIIFILVGAIMISFGFDVAVGPTTLGTILVVLGVIALIIWFVLVVWGHVKAA